MEGLLSMGPTPPSFPLGTVYGGGYDCERGTVKGEGVWNKVTKFIIMLGFNIMTPNI